MWGYPGAQNKFTAIVSVRGHVDASRLRPDGANSECGRGLFAITKVGPSGWPSTKKHRLFLATTFPVPAQLAASSPALQPLSLFPQINRPKERHVRIRLGPQPWNRLTQEFLGEMLGARRSSR